MHGQSQPVNQGASFEKTAIDIVGPFPQNNQMKWLPLIPVNYFKWPVTYAVSSQEVLTVAEALVNSYFCCVIVSLELQ
jgi:hypothetical protein